MVVAVSIPYLVYADGSCFGNGGVGGYCAIVVATDGTTREIIGRSDGATTNNIMELMAVIVGLEAVEGALLLELRSDSQYVVTGMSERLAVWKANGWRTADNKPIKNRDLWERLDRAASAHRIAWVWVRGHDGDALNERADQLARAAAEGR